MGVAQVPLMTRALQVTTPGGPQVQEVRDVELRAPGPDEVLVRVEASGVNFIDVYQREGIYPQPTPFTLGVEGAGVELATGRRVAWCMSNGAHAEHAVVPGRRSRTTSLTPLNWLGGQGRCLPRWLVARCKWRSRAATHWIRLGRRTPPWRGVRRWAS